MDPSKLSIISPEGIRIFEIKDGEISIPKSGQEKFDTCSYRSDTEVIEVKRSCCSSKEIKGFKCNKFDIIPVRPEQCVACGDYIAK